MKNIDPRGNKRWINKIISTCELIQPIANQNIMQIISYLFRKDEKNCEILCKNAGEPISEYKGPKTAEIINNLLEASLSVLSELENMGLNYVGISSNSIMFNPGTKKFKIFIESSNKIIPRWAIKNLTILKKIKQEYSSPEIYNQIWKNTIKNKGNLEFSELSELPNYSGQFVYSWGMIIYNFLTDQFLRNEIKSNPAKYDEFVKEIDLIKLENDPEFKITNKLRLLLKLALAYDYKERPSFNILKQIYESKINYTETAIFELLKSKCKICGNLLEKSTKVCELCQLLSIEKISGENFDNCINKNSEATLNILSNLDLLSPQISKLFEAFSVSARVVSQEVSTEFWYNTWKFIFKNKYENELAINIKHLINSQLSNKTIDMNYQILLNLRIIEDLMPYKGVLLPNLFTITHNKNIRPRLDEDKYDKFQPIIFELLARCKKICEENYIDEYTNFLLQENRARYANNFDKVNCDRAFELLKKASCYDMKNVTPQIDIYKLISQNERILRIGVEFHNTSLIESRIKPLADLVIKKFDPNDCDEYIKTLNSLYYFKQGNYAQIVNPLMKYFSLNVARLGNKSNYVLMNFYAGCCNFYSNNAVDGFKFYDHILSEQCSDEFPEMCFDICMIICKFLIKSKEFSKISLYAQKAYEICKTPESILYSYCALRAAKHDSDAENLLEIAYEMITNPFITAYKNMHSINAMILFEIGNLAYAHKKFVKAREKYEKALEILHQIAHTTDEDAYLQVKILMNLGNTERQLLLTEHACNLYEKAMNQGKIAQLGNKGYDELCPIIMFNMGTISLEMNKKDAGITIIKLSKKLLCDIGKTESSYYKTIQIIENKLSSIHPNTTIISNNDSDMSESLVNMIPLADTKEQNEIRDILVDVIQNYDFYSVFQFLTSMFFVLHNATEHFPDSYIVLKSEDFYRTGLENIKEASIILKKLGYIDVGDCLALDKMNTDLHMWTLGMFAKLTSSFKVISKMTTNDITR